MWIVNRHEFARRSSCAQNTAFHNRAGWETHDDQSTTSVQSPRSGRAHEAEDGLVYRSQLCRYRGQKQALCCNFGRIRHPSPAVAAREGQLLLERGRIVCSAGDRHVRPDLGVGSGSYEIAHEVFGSAPRPNTTHRLFIFQEPWIRID
jgi:hypothetical protein